MLATHPVILLPQRADPLLEVDEDPRSTEHLRVVLRGYADTVNLLGLPSAFVPTGLGDGLPTGVQIVAAAHREDLCLAVAAAIEAHLGTLVERCGGAFDRRRQVERAMPASTCCSAARRTRHACHRWRRSWAARTCRPVARLNRTPRMNGLGKVTPVRSIPP